MIKDLIDDLLYHVLKLILADVHVLELLSDQLRVVIGVARVLKQLHEETFGEFLGTPGPLIHVLECVI